MSNVIHGNSHQCIKFMREKPAALSVLWIYASRTNADGVAWPSLRGLAKSTGWSVPVCQEARDYLVEKGVLEEVKDYLRPQWREIPAQALTRIKNIDHSQYFKVTGKFTHNKKTYPLFYHGGDQPASVDEKVDEPADDSSDVQSGCTSDGVAQGSAPLSNPVAHRTALHMQPGCTELDLSNSSELNSSKAELKAAATPAAPALEPLVTSAALDALIFTPEMLPSKHEPFKEIVTTPQNGKTPTPVPAHPSPIDEPRAEIFGLYEQAFGRLVDSAMLKDELKDSAETFPMDWIRDALKETVLAGVKNWKYTRKILERWQLEGRKPNLTVLPKPAEPAPAMVAKNTQPQAVWTPTEDDMKLFYAVNGKASGDENGSAT